MRYPAERDVRATAAHGQFLDAELQSQETSLNLIHGARELGDPARGAVVFFQKQLACSKCHSVGNQTENALVLILYRWEKITPIRF